MIKRFLQSILFVTMGVVLARGGMCGAVTAAEQAEKGEVRYSYDSLGRVVKAVYPEGESILYSYDANGNLLEVKKEVPEEEKPQEGQQEETKTPGRTQLPSTYMGYRTFPVVNLQGVVLNPSYTEKDIKNYNQFKKKVPKIKSLKCKVSKKKYSLSIIIRQVNPLKSYGETGYEIRYSNSSKFRKSKKVTVSRRKKGKTTGRTWTVKKGKTYYVKVRAYMKTVTGKKIHTKYSRVKKIKAVK